MKLFGYLGAWCPPRSAEREASLHRLVSLVWERTGPDLWDGSPSDQRIGPRLRPNIEDTIRGKGRTPPVTVGWAPGTKFAYSGGGTSILQVLVEKVTGKPYAQVVQERVLDKLKMDDSRFTPDQTRVVTGTNYKYATIPGGARRYPELAAAGLWSTAGDLAKMALGIQSCLEGKDGSLFSKELAREMVTPDPKIEGQYTGLAQLCPW